MSATADSPRADRPARPVEVMALADTVSWRKGLATMWRVTRYAADTPWQVVTALVATLLAAALQLVIPRLLGHAVDQTQTVLASGGREAVEAALWSTAVLVLVVSALRGVFATLQNYYSEAVGHHTGYRLRMQFYDKIQHLSFGFHDSVHSGDLITLGLLDIEGARMFFSTGLIRFVLLVILIGIGGYGLLATDWVLGLMALSFVPYVGWESSVSQLKLRGTWLVLQKRLDVLSRVMEENLAGIRVVRAFSAQGHEVDKFRRASTSALELAHERVDIRVRSTSLMTLTFFIAMGLVLLVGGFKVQSGQITVGTLAAFLTFMTILQMPVRQLGMLVNSIARTSTCGARLFALLDLTPAVADPPGAPALVLTNGTLRFDGVGFAYPSAPDKPVLEGISFTARRGETIGLIGPQGSGKTTIAQLIPRFYDVTAGAITLDGQDIRDVSLRSLREQVTVVSQDVFMFTTTMENNIAYGDPWAQEPGDRGRIGTCTVAQLYRRVAGTLSHRRGRTRRIPVRRPAAADVDRAQPDPDARRAGV